MRENIRFAKKKKTIIDSTIASVYIFTAIAAQLLLLLLPPSWGLRTTTTTTTAAALCISCKLADVNRSSTRRCSLSSFLSQRLYICPLSQHNLLCSTTCATPLGAQVRDARLSRGWCGESHTHARRTESPRYMCVYRYGNPKRTRINVYGEK